MKKITLLFLMVFLFSLGAISQNGQINELLERLEVNKNSSGNLSEFFSVKELKILRDHLSKGASNSNTTQDRSTDGPIIAFGWESQGNGFGSFDVCAPEAYTNISPGSGTGGFESAGAVNPLNLNQAYVMDNNGVLYEVQIDTGEYTVLSTGLTLDITGMEFDVVDNTLYAITSTDLFIIDPVALSSTLVGPLNTVGAIAIALAIDGNGVGYTYDIADDTFYSVDLTTGNATAIGAIGFDAAFGQGMFWDPSEDRILMASFDNSSFFSELREVDITTGATTVLGEIIPGATTQVAWATLPFQFELNDDPETATNLVVGEVFEDNPKIAENTEATATTIDDPSCGNFAGGDLWYSLVVPESGNVSVETQVDDESITDTALSVYEGEIGALVEVVCSDNDGIDLFSFVELLGRTPGEVLFVRVWESEGDAIGTFQISAFDTPPPANDDPAGAFPLMMGAVFADFPLTATNFKATDTAIDDPTCGDYGGADVWFTVVPPSTGQFVLEIDTAGGITDTGMSVYTGTPDALVEIDCDDDGGTDAFSLIELTDQDPASTIFVRVWESGGGDFGLFQIAAYSNCPVNGADIEITGTGETAISICTTDGVPDPIDVTIVGDPVGANDGWVITDQATGDILGLPMAPPFDLDGVPVGICEIWYIRYEDGLTGLEMGLNVSGLDGCFDLSNPIAVTRGDDGTVCPPSNDACENAIALDCDTTVVGTTLLATDDGSNPAPDVFYTYTGSGSNENITISLCDGDTDFDSLLRVFDDECTLVNEIATNDDSCGFQSEVTFLSDGATTYTIMVEGFGTNSGNYSLAVTCEMLPDCLTIESLASTNITETTADLSWTDINPTPAASYDVEWGETGFTLGTGTVETGVGNPFTLEGLTANTTFDFYVTGNCGDDGFSEVSSVGTFTTSPEQAPPGECEWTLEMFDTFGDGWNGALLNVFRNGQVVLFEVTLDDDPNNDGDTGSLQFEVLPGDDITTVLVDGGDFPAEISYNILNADGATVEGSGDSTNNITTGTITGDCALSVGDNTIVGFKIFPNPATNEVNISAASNIENVTVFNLLGQKVIEAQIGATSQTIDVSLLQTGAYLMQVTADGQSGIYRFVKK